MNREEILQFVKDNPVCFLATVEDNAPRVRGIGTYKVDERGILIQISTPKDVYKQIVKNPKVELCYNNLAKGIQVRVSGTAEFLEDQSVKEEVVDARPFLKSLVEENGYDVIKVFRVAKAIAYVWTREKNFAPKEYIQL
ncbi:MAG TPA: pyridoxamine 5'-phosphate oxidase family protein [Syntrophorhabdaceae bacterium]|nr:pyridoxamine 5'-phosphate oxidase family protein [Syntrophorhabdaceae bacterium]